MRLYPTVTVKPQDFSKEKVMTVPNQAMSLQEIIRRFTRRESLPVEKQGIYVENMGDLEKMANADITVQHEHIAKLKSAIAAAKEREKKAKESASAGSPPSSKNDQLAAQAAANVMPTPPANPQGGVTGKPDVAQAP